MNIDDLIPEALVHVVTQNARKCGKSALMTDAFVAAMQGKRLALETVLVPIDMAKKPAAAYERNWLAAERKADRLELRVSYLRDALNKIVATNPSRAHDLAHAAIDQDGPA